MRRRWLPLTVLVVALLGLVASMLLTLGRPAVTGEAAVRDLADARAAAQRFADRFGLRVGEVMEFDNGFYAELVDADDNGATEVLVDPGTGSTWFEHGPAMMWNTRYGMRHHVGGCDAPGDPALARRIADDWLREYRPGERAGAADAFPGYYTLHTLRDGQVSGMLSVRCGSGQVWYHSWHGRFIRMR